MNHSAKSALQSYKAKHPRFDPEKESEGLTDFYRHKSRTKNPTSGSFYAVYKGKNLTYPTVWGLSKKDVTKFLTQSRVAFTSIQALI